MTVKWPFTTGFLFGMIAGMWLARLIWSLV